jgi:hypothetical protein
MGSRSGIFPYWFYIGSGFPWEVFENIRRTAEEIQNEYITNPLRKIKVQPAYNPVKALPMSIVS